MLNHARTLLLNVSGPSFDLQAPGEEYVPPDFQAVVLPPTLQSLHAILLGTSPDRLYLNYRLRQYMRLLHSTPFSAYVTNLDDRLTYLPFPAIFEYWFGERIQAGLTNSGSCQLVTVATQPADESRGVTTSHWQLQIATFAGNNGELQVTQNSQTRTVPFSISYSLSNTISLDSQGLSVQLSGVPVVGDSWLVDCYSRPRRDLMDILSTLLSFAGNTGTPDLFRSGEPYDTFYQLWANHPVALYRLCGLLLALIYRTQDIREGAA